MKSKKNLIVMTLVLLLTLSWNAPRTIAANQFKDVKPDDPHYEGINWLADKGIQGYEDNTFGKYVELKREHAAVMFAKALGLPLPPKKEVENYYSDITAEHRYAEYIAAVGKAGIFKGKEGKVFAPKQVLTRQQMASTIVSAYDFEMNDLNTPINLKNVHDIHKNSVQILANLDITSEVNDFRPRKDINRGQFATFLYRSDQVNGKEFEVKQYNYKFSTILNKQMSANPMPQTDSNGVWYDASENLTQYYLNPRNFKKYSKEYYQYLKLSGSSNMTVDQLNRKVLNDKGMLQGLAAEFKKASEKHKVNDIYLISHALLETGNGKSELANGVEVGVNEDGVPVRVTKNNQNKLKKIKTTYNFFGIGANDSCAITCGSERAYLEGWFTPAKAVKGGASFINNSYISRGQDTIYKMRWNPDNPGTQQYATDVGWATKQTKNIKKTYDLVKDVEGLILKFEVPEYENQPKPNVKETGAGVFNINTNHANAGKKGTVTASALNLRTGPTTNFSVVRALPKGTSVDIIGENTGWYKVRVGKQDGWVSASYINFNKARTLEMSNIIEPITRQDEELLAKELNSSRIIGEITVDKAVLNKEAYEGSKVIIDNLAKNTKVNIIDEKDDWFYITIDGHEGWIKNDYISIINTMFVISETKLKDKPNGKTIDTVNKNETIVIIPTEDLELTEDSGWYKLHYKGQEAWIKKNRIK